MTHQRRQLGAAGEQSAADWYLREGYEVVARNWRCREGELDLIVRRGSELVFCEVKTRSSTAFGTPAEAVTRSKQVRLRRLAAAYLQATGRHRGSIRFDVVAVLSGEVEVIEAAF